MIHTLIRLPRCFIGSVILILTIGLHSVSSAQHEKAIDQATTLIESMMELTGAPGIAVSVGIKGHIVWSEGFGYADLEQHVPIYPAITRFRIGSVSKPMTAVAVAQLYEQGRLDLDAPVQKYVPSFPKKEKGTITTRLLAGHLAGIRHYRNNEFLSREYHPTVMEGLDIFKDDTLLFVPGARYSYSSYAWNLISAVVEGASGEEFLSYMSKNVFREIGMNHTIADHISPIIENRTRYYSWQDGQICNAPAVDNSYKWAGGGFLSTSEDLIRFGFAHSYTEILKSETMKVLWTSQQTTDGKETGYGIGWSVGSDSKNRIFRGHGGGSVGGTTAFRVYPDSQIVVAVISNASGVRFGNVTEKIADLFMGMDVKKDVSAALLPVILHDGAVAATDHYQYLKINNSHEYEFNDEQELNGLGYALLTREKFDEAIAIFKLNSKEFNNSAFAHSRLGDAYSSNDQFEEAKNSYELAIEVACENSPQYISYFENKLEQINKKLLSDK